MPELPFHKKNGMILIDKPAGMSSAQVVARVKRLTGAKKVGHTGTLDPFATGLMICGINGGTRLSRFFLDGDKTYKAGLLLGLETDTFDCTGEIIQKCDEGFFEDLKLNRKYFLDLFSSFEGEQEQLPPVYSALKHNGVPLYKLARKGTPVQKPPRKINIYNIIAGKIDLPLISFDVSCSSGTYIRTLAADLGKKIGCGGHLVSLRRTRTCGFTIDDAVTLEEMSMVDDPSVFLVSMDDALPDMTCHIASASLEKKIDNGVEIEKNDGIEIPEKEESEITIKILNKKNQMIAIVNYVAKSDKYKYCCVFHN